MIDIAVVGGAATKEWVARQGPKLISEGLQCFFVDRKTGPARLPDSDLWLVDFDCMAPQDVELLEVTNAVTGEPLRKQWLAMARSFSFELIQAVLLMGASRCLTKPVTSRVLLECCRELGIGTPPCNGMLAVLEDREPVYNSLDKSLSGTGLKATRLVDLATGVVVLQRDPPDGLVVSHYPESLPIRSVIDLLRSFPELSAVPVFIIRGKTSHSELVGALDGLVDVICVPGVDGLADAVTTRFNRSSPTNSARQHLYERFHHYEQERRALHLHAIVSKTDRAGRIIEVNDRFCEVSGYSVDELIGQNHRILKSGSHPPEFYRELWSTVSQGDVWRGEICNRAKDGSFYWVSSTIVPYLDQSGRPYQYIAIRKDITHVKGAEALISQQGRLAARLGEAGARLLDVGWEDSVEGLQKSLAPLCALLEADGVVINLDDEYPFLLDGIKALPVIEGLPALRIETVGTSDASDASARKPIVEARLMANDIQVGRVALNGSDNAMVETFANQGLVELLGNIVVAAMARWQREFEQEQSRERLRIAQKYSGIGTWEWRIATGNLYWTEQIPVLFGYSEGALETSYENFISAVHPEDREQVEIAISRTIEKDHPYRIEHRTVWPDGQVRWLLETGDITRNEVGEAVRMLGVVQDVTDIREAELKLEAQASLLNMLHDSLNTFVLEGKFQATLDAMLDSLIRLTDSEFGYLVEVLHDHSEEPYLRVQSMSDISWDAISSEMINVTGKDRFELRELDNMLGVCIREGRPVVVNQSSSEDAFSRLLPGQSRIRTFLSVPIFVGDELVGTFALANRQDGYDDRLIEFLRPFMATYGVILKSQRMLDAEAVNHKNLIRAKQRADLANRAKSEFLSSMSHELRTPLNAILGFGQLLEIDAGLNDEQQDNVQEILKASRHLLTLINEVLDLAKIEAGKLDLSLENIPVDELLEETLTLVQHMAHARGISLRMEGADSLRVMADWTRLKQAVLNLISNAIKYNRAQGEVLISARPHGENWVEIRVSDTGPGIEPSRIAELFQPFNRLGAELSHIEGTGIGLALTQRLAELMGGSVGVESQLNQGSTFWLRLPAEHGSSAIDTHGAPVIQPQSQSVQNSGEPIEEVRTVLYIEDNPANLKLVARILQRYPGVRLLTTSSGIEGLAIARAERPDIVLLDIHLPDADGYQLLGELKSTSETESIPVVALTANAMSGEVRRGIQAGFDDYLTKPISMDELLTIMETYLR